MSNPTADQMIERLIQAAVDYERAEGMYTAGARRELSEATAAIKAACALRTTAPTEPVTDAVQQCLGKYGSAFDFINGLERLGYEIIRARASAHMEFLGWTNGGDAGSIKQDSEKRTIAHYGDLHWLADYKAALDHASKEATA